MYTGDVSKIRRLDLLIPKIKYPDWGRTGEEISPPKFTVSSIRYFDVSLYSGMGIEFLGIKLVRNISRESNTLV